MWVSVPQLHAPFARYFRRRRFRWLAQIFSIGPQTTILDLGGYEYYWSYLDQRPRVTIVNLDLGGSHTSNFCWLAADARKLPFLDRSFDVVFANSIIEHVGDQESRYRFAREVERVGRSYYIQTPNYWFPFEPHLLTPFIHFFPTRLKKILLRNFTVWGLLVRPTRQGCEEFVRDVRLLNAKELQELFPKARIHRERFLGFTKSLIAVSREQGQEPGM
ncbi:MAG: methyltransferase type 11 [Solibacterales bacterium]|nr:methyltransferase type 11 [Bryobacterales bacterium]